MNNRKFLRVTQLVSLCLIFSIIIIAKYFHLNRYLTGPQMIIIGCCLIVFVSCAFCLHDRMNLESLFGSPQRKLRTWLLVLLISSGLLIGIVHFTNYYILNITLPSRNECQDLPKLQLRYTEK